MAIEAYSEGRRPAPTVLVIDDDPDVQQFTARALTSAGYCVVVATDVHDALNVSGAHPSKIDLALIDVILPSGTGIDLATALVANRPDMRVVYMSGFPADVIQTVQHDGGPDGQFLEKPFSARVLLQRIQDVLPIPANRNTPSLQTQPIAAIAAPDPTSTGANADAVYRLETPVRCPQCGETITTLRAVRLLRTQVNFTSTLPRRGRILACASCLCIVSAELTNF